MTQDRPVHEIRMGKIRAAVWKHTMENGARYSVSIKRIYKTEKGWESTTSFGRDDLPLVAKVADLMHTWIYEQNDAQRNEMPSNETSPPRNNGYHEGNGTHRPSHNNRSERQSGESVGNGRHRNSDHF